MADAPPPLAMAPLTLAKLPYPPYVLALAAITAVAFLFALARAPRALGYGIEAERGRRALAAGRFAEADRRLGRVVRAFPEAKETRIDYAEACVKADDADGANEALGWFSGREVSKDENERLDAIQAEGGRRFKTAPDAPGMANP